MPLKQQKNAGNARKMLLMLAFFFKNPLSVKNAFLMPAQLPDAYSGVDTNEECDALAHQRTHWTKVVPISPFHW